MRYLNQWIHTQIENVYSTHSKPIENSNCKKNIIFETLFNSNLNCRESLNGNKTIILLFSSI